ncbi:hypothetical protein ABZ863_25740 [Saccharomonospora sp. NPDC046836]|uniref:hypothetical protein n=1 Tax=Saccharomonospora sp. NPDC046836 TaxID=3156921 RepID=UPI0033C32EF4
MDERELTELFRDAPGEPPPPRFGLAEVTTASRRAGVRRRSLLAGVACAVVVLGGAAGAAGVLLSGSGGSNEQTTAAAPAHGAAQPGESPERLPQTQSFPEPGPKQGGTADGERTLGCDKVDRELATALAGELPVAAATTAGPGRSCPTGTSTAGFQLDGGTVTAVLAPRGLDVPLPGQPQGSEVAQQATASGGTIFVISTPAAGSAEAPLAAELDRIASALAARF